MAASKKDLGKAPVPSLFFYFYLPTLVSMVSVSAHQLINGIILGRQVGKEAIAAVGLYAPILLIFISFLLAFMIGGGITFSKSSGAGDVEQARRVFRFSTTAVLTAGGLVALGAPWLAEPVARFVAGTESGPIFRFTTQYLFWNFLFLPVLFLRLLWGAFITNDNAPSVNRNVTFYASMLNILLDVLLVVVFPFGIAGAAVATGLSLLAAVAYQYRHIRKSQGVLTFDHWRFTLRLPEWRRFFRLGFPSFTSELVLSAGLLLLNRSLLPYGVSALSAFGLVNYLNNIFLRFFTASMMSVQPIIGFNIGARQPGRVREVLGFSLLFTLALGAVFYGLGFAFPQVLISLVTSNESVGFRTEAEQAIRYGFLLYLVAGPNYILTMYMQCIGRFALSIAISALKGLGFVGLFLLLLPEYFGLHLNGVWLSRPLAELATLTVIGGYTLSQKMRYYSREAILR
ncbi:MATE family efflux transporter [Larkinella soli]|uniref:MATE family efflux transporter n=1 Tax=Larkinella soli TaxID=1770527 RepID=UPI000FFBC348|nr:MATE family efflux transporter [Larkinella soli]